MKVVCCYCKKFMYYKKPHENKSVSHGICEPCNKKILEEMNEELDRLIGSDKEETTDEGRKGKAG
jgi:transposase-like protein